MFLHKTFCAQKAVCTTQNASKCQLTNASVVAISCSRQAFCVCERGLPRHNANVAVYCRFWDSRCSCKRAGMMQMVGWLPPSLGEGLVVPRFYCSRHMHGNFVMQKVIQMLPPNSLGFMIYELKEGGWMWLICRNQLKQTVPVVPHKAVAEVSKIGNL